MNRIHVATEDELSEAVGARLIKELGPNFGVSLQFRRGGFGYLRSKLASFCEIAKREAILLITDLDTGECASKLADDWFGTRQCPELLLFRVAVREVESWLLADHEAMKELLKKGAGKLPRQPDALVDPKSTLLQLAKKAPRDVRKDLLAERGAFAAQGLGYNKRLCFVVRESWNPERAALRSESLQRARMRLRALAGKIEKSDFPGRARN